MIHIRCFIYRLCALWMLSAGVFTQTAAAKSPLTIYSNTDIWVFQYIMDAFKTAYPHVSIQYVEYDNAIDLYNDIIHRHTHNTTPPDVVISSATHLQFELVQNYGAVPFLKTPIQNAPSQDSVQIWNNRLLAFSYEQGVIVYNTKYIPAVPKTHYELDIYIQNTPLLHNKITRYDITKSAVGYLFAIQNYVSYQDMPNLWNSLGCASNDRDTSTLSMLQKVNSGQAYMAYNVLGSYAGKFIADKPHLKSIALTDYPVGILRSAFIPTHAPNAKMAKTFLQFLSDPQHSNTIIASINALPVNRHIPNVLKISPGMLLFNDTYYKNNILSQWQTTSCPK